MNGPLVLARCNTMIFIPENILIRINIIVLYFKPNKISEEFVCNLKILLIKDKGFYILGFFSNNYCFFSFADNLTLLYCLNSFFFCSFSGHSLRYALFVYRLIVATLIGNFYDDPFLN